MLFRKVINELEEVCSQMFHAAQMQQWDNVATLDRQRERLLLAMSETTGHELDDRLRQQIETILDLDQKILDVIRQGRSSARRQIAKEDASHRRGLEMYTSG